jgi:hypothetical protein
LNKSTGGLLVAAGVIAGVAILVKKAFASQYETFPASSFFQPDKVTYLANILDAEDEDEFILNAWRYVGDGIAIEYEPIGSDIDFDGSTVSCLYCWSVEETLAKGKGNCVCKSAVLASILLNRESLAQDRVYMVIGEYSALGYTGGHSWVELIRNGISYVLEATSSPNMVQPWMPLSEVADIYHTYARFSQDDFLCLDTEFCMLVSECACGRRIWAH